MPIINIEEVSFSYENNGNYVIDDLSLQVNRGEFVAIIGHNGSGKSTLAKLMNVLYFPSKGKIFICNIDTSGEKDTWKVRRHAGMVFQNPDNQIVATVVKEDVAFGLENIGIPHEDMDAVINTALENVGMLEFADRAPHLLSGGQKQRVAIAGVLAMLPDAIIFDESTSMLDPSGRNEILDTVFRLNKEKGLTVIWITHFMEEAALADRVVVFNKGKIQLSGTPTEVFRNVNEIRKLGLDVPPMVELANFLREQGMDIKEDVLSVDDMVEELTRIYGN